MLSLVGAGRKSSLSNSVVVNKPFACTVCSRTFNSKYNVVRHLRQYHASGRAFKCAVCARDYKWIDSLHKHMKTHKSLDCSNDSGLG